MSRSGEAAARESIDAFFAMGVERTQIADVKAATAIRDYIARYGISTCRVLMNPRTNNYYLVRGRKNR